ncbi:MAG TPA: DUF2231 domain-containing protein [Gemmatimonadales bacterium]|nr:DUF2231 domain-containing protein [Gemmatimonadales bacterium]
MESKARFLGHPIHQMLIVFPLGLLATAVIFDIINLVAHDPRWAEAAFFLIRAGVVGGVIAGIFGVIDWLAIPRRTRAKRIGLWHGVGNLVVLGLFVVDWLLRRDTPATPPTAAVVAGILGVGLALVTGWLGGELVDRLGVGVAEGAHLNSPSSLSQLPASMYRNDTGASHRWTGPERRTQPAHAFTGRERRRATVA